MKTLDRIQHFKEQLRRLALNSTMGAVALSSLAGQAHGTLIGHWLSGAENLQDSSGYTPAGTHDGIAVGGNAAQLAYATDLPPGFSTGKSVDLSATEVGIQVANSATTDGVTYLNTFDEGVRNELTVAFWAKGMPGTWSPWIAKRGEDNVGWQVRRMGGNPYAGFTVRGLSNDNGDNGGINVDDTPPKWHHFVAVWDQATATRTVYVDGAVSSVVTNTSGQTMTLAPGSHLTLGGRQGSGSGFDSYFTGKLFDVRIYNQAFGQSDVDGLIPQVVPQNVVAVSGSQKINLSWDTSLGASQYTVSTKNTVTNVEVTDIVTAAPGVIPSIVKTGLTNGVPYVFKVMASNSVLNSAYSAEVTATPGLGTAKDILTFDAVGAQPGIISGNTITLNVPSDTDVTGLFINYTVSPFATEDADKPSGQVFLDFTTPQTFTITAEDGSTKVYTVSVVRFSLLTYDFSTGLQGWTQIWPAIGNGSLWEDGALGNGTDGASTRFGRSPEFFLNTGEMTFRMTGGQGALAAPGVGPSDIPENSISDGGFAGVALRDVATNTYIMSKRCKVNGSVYFQYSFTEAELAPYANDGKRYTLDFIDYNKGGWGWVRLDDVNIRGTLAPVGPNAPEANILSFSYLGQPAKVSGTSITLAPLPAGSSVTALAPIFTLSDGATCDKVSGNAYDFTNPVTYTVTSSDLATVKVYTVTAEVLPNPALALVGHWVSGAETLVNSSTYAPAGTHDGIAVGGNASLLTYSTDLPAGFSGKSLDLSAGDVAVQISNSATGDAGYLNTYDDQIRSHITVAFWARGMPGTWSPWISKGGEDGVGWQMRRMDANPYAGFTIRGLGNQDGWGSSTNVNDNNWHHFAGVWDETTGVRSLYIDGVLSLEDQSPGSVMTLASGRSLVLGGRYNGGGGIENFFQGKLFDVRIYKQKLFANEIQALMVPAADGFSTWINANYPTLSDKTPGGDPDHDGFTNFQEFAFGLNPSSPSVNPVTLPNKTTGVFEYTRLATSGLTYSVKTSTDLVNWVTDSGATAGQVVTSTVGGVQTVKVTLSGAPLSGSKLFVRISAQ